MQRRRFITSLAFGMAAYSYTRSQNCSGTTDDITGPFYLPDSPNRKKLVENITEGVPLVLNGTVKNCNKEIEGATVEIWHASPAGCYTGFDCQPIPSTPEEYLYRGTQTTTAEGKYGFETILPGRYKNGAEFRPRHIHYRIRTYGESQNEHVDLITQLYFEGDEYIAADPWASAPKAEDRIVPLNGTMDDGYTSGFNIILPDATTTLRQGRTPSRHHMSGADLIVRRHGPEIMIDVQKEYLNGNLYIYNRLGKNLFSHKIHSPNIRFLPGDLSAGIYFLKLLKTHSPKPKWFHLNL